MMLIYPVVLFKDKDGDYGAVVPDLPGCVSAGDTVEQAVRGIEEAIYCHLEGMAMDGESFPKPSDVEEVSGKREFRSGLGWYFVPVDLGRLSTAVERVNITLPKWLLQAIDAAAPNRSRFLAESALRALSDTRSKDTAA
jgi:predicted RNase H-like HicB family nuclease